MSTGEIVALCLVALFCAVIIIASIRSRFGRRPGKLLPRNCSRCHAKAGTCWTQEGKHVVRCPRCGEQSREYQSRRQAVAAWNNRVR